MIVFSDRVRKAFGNIDSIVFCKRIFKYCRKNIFIFKPASCYISPSATIRVSDKFLFNKQWDKIRIHRNRIAGSLYVADRAHVSVGDFTCYAGSRITVNKDAELILKSGYINYESAIECFDRIEIGEDCVISERVMIRDANNHSLNKEGFARKSPIKIGDHVWIGMGAMVLSGVTIGDGAVIGAGAVVTKDVPANSLAVGVPARVVRENVEWSY